MMRRVKAHLLLLAALCLGAAHGAVAAEGVPRPKLRPTAPASATPVAAAPIPRPRPTQKDESQPPAEETSGSWSAAEVAATRAACATLLSGLDIRYRPVDPIGGQGGCGAPAPIEVSAVAGVMLVPPATQTCAMAAALAAWVTDDVQPAARKRLDTDVTEIRTATSYACRRRNNGPAGTMSEHSKANALDMSGFTFAKTADVAVGGSGNWGEGLRGAIGLSRGGSFLEDIRSAACAHFTTVLGPGSDPYHGDHFHVDVLQRKGGYRICQ